MSADRPGRAPATPAAPPAVSPAAGDPRSTAQLLSDVANEARTLVRKELELAKQEIAAGVRARVQALVLALAGAVFGLFALAYLGITVGVALRPVLPDWLAWAIVFAGHLLIAVVALLLARRRATSTSMSPEATKRSIEETKQWAKQQRRR